MLRKTGLYAILFAGFCFISQVASALTLRSPAFAPKQTIPIQYTCDGLNYSPPLIWNDVPKGTKSFVLFLTDPDASSGTWYHWILYNIPANVRGLNENIQILPFGTQVGKNSWQRPQYNGPCPPTREHRYFFKLYAMKTLLKLPDRATKDEVANAMHRHIAAKTELMTRYMRSKH